MNDRVLKAIEVGSVFKIPEDFTQKEESYAKACIFFNRGKYEECLLEIIFLDGCGLIDMPLVISAFCLYLQTKVHYSVLYIVSIIIRQHADKIDSHFSTCLKDAIYGYGLKHDEYPKCIEDNLQSFIYKKIDLDIDFDQMIWEFGGQWIHISYNENGNRRQVLEAYKDENNKTKYKEYPTKYTSL